MSNLPAALDYSSPKLIQTIQQTVAKGATEEEFAMFVETCKATGLNPFKKEIWFIKTQKGVQLMTGINGYLAIANKHPMFDGMECDVESGKDGKPVKAIAKVYRKDRSRPSVGIALMAEYGGSTPIWQQKPTVMLLKVAKSIALREAFPQELNGLYTEEEMPTQYSPPPLPEKQKLKPYTPDTVDYNTGEILPPEQADEEPDDINNVKTLIELKKFSELGERKLLTTGSQHTHKTILEIFTTDPKWVEKVLATEKTRSKLDPRDLLAIEAYKGFLEGKEDA